MNLVIKGEPTPNVRPRTTKGMMGVYQPKNKYYFQILNAFKEEVKKPDFKKLTGPIEVKYEFYFQRPKYHYTAKGKIKKQYECEWHIKKPDTDNLLKCIKDAITRSGFWQDDSQACYEIIKKKYIDYASYTSITIIQIN